MAVGGGKAAATGGSNADAGLTAMQATVNQAATDLQQLVLQLEGVRSATDIEDLDTRGREAAVYLDRVVAQHEKAATNASSDARAAAVRNRGRLESLERRLRSARRTAAQVSAAADRAALLNGGESRRKGKNQAVVSETLRAAKSQLSSNIDSGLEALKQLKSDHEKMKVVDDTFGGLEKELDTGTSILTRFKSRDFIDRLYIGLALAVYCFVVAWIIYRRLGLHRILTLVRYILDLAYQLCAPLLSLLGGSDDGDGANGDL